MTMTLDFLRQLSDREVVGLMSATNPLNKARQVFSGMSAKIEQAGMQRKPLSSIDMRRMEFEAVLKIADALGVTIDD